MHGRALTWPGAPSSRVRWTGYVPNRYVVILAVPLRSKGVGECGGSGSLGKMTPVANNMTDGMPSSAVDVGAVIPATLDRAEGTYM